MGTKGIIQNPLWIHRRRLSILETGLKNVERRYAEDIENRKRVIEELKLFIRELETAELDEMSL